MQTFARSFHLVNPEAAGVPRLTVAATFDSARGSRVSRSHKGTALCAATKRPRRLYHGCNCKALSQTHSDKCPLLALRVSRELRIAVAATRDKPAAAAVHAVGVDARGQHCRCDA